MQSSQTQSEHCDPNLKIITSELSNPRRRTRARLYEQCKNITRKYLVKLED